MSIILTLAATFIVVAFALSLWKRTEAKRGGARTGPAPEDQDADAQFLDAAERDGAARLLRVEDSADLIYIRPLLSEAGILSYVDNGAQTRAFPGLLEEEALYLWVLMKDRDAAAGLIQDYIDDKKAAGDVPAAALPHFV